MELIFGRRKIDKIQVKKPINKIYAKSDVLRKCTESCGVEGPEGLLSRGS